MYFKILTGLATVSLMIGCGSSDSSATLEYLEIKDNDIYITENRAISQDIVYEYLQNDALVWTISGGADQNFFNLNDTELNSTIVFDFEAPQDVDTNNIYEVQVDVTDGTHSDTKALRIHVVDEKIVSSDSAYEYETITSNTGKIWLNRNLGAQYSEIGGGDYNPTATGIGHEAYGSLFQWGRKADGHEYLHWTTNSNTDNTIVTTNEKKDVPNHNNFIRTTNEDWRTSPASNLWSGTNSVNNPCPTGFRVPTQVEFQAEIDTDANFANTIRLPNADDRPDTTGIPAGNNFGAFWSSTEHTSSNFAYHFDTGTTAVKSDKSKATGMSVRCIKD